MEREGESDYKRTFMGARAGGVFGKLLDRLLGDKTINRLKILLLRLIISPYILALIFAESI